MSYMVYVSKESGLLTEKEKQRIIGCMIGLELPVWHEEFTMELIQRSLQERLKHSGGLVRMPLPVGLGQAGGNGKSILKIHFLQDQTGDKKCKVTMLPSHQVLAAGRKSKSN